MFRSSRIHQGALLSATAIIGYQNELFSKCSGSSSSQDKEEDTFFDYFPMKQLYQPKRPYPAWDSNWDGKESKKGTNLKGGIICF